MGTQQRTFVVGVDASDESDRALQWARSSAGPNDEIFVVDPFETVSLYGQYTFEEWLGGDTRIRVGARNITDEEYAVLGDGFAIDCLPCPPGADCGGGLTARTDVAAKSDGHFDVHTARLNTRDQPRLCAKWIHSCMPEKPMKPIAIKPIMTKVIPVPWSPSGTSL